MSNEIITKRPIIIPEKYWELILENYICPKCKGVINNAVQAPDCGCQYCLECLVDLTKNGFDVDCLKCSVKLESDAKYPDKNLEKKIRKFLETTIINCDKCTSEKISLKDYQVHYIQEHTPQTTICKYCQKKFEKLSELNLHTDIDIGNCSEQPLYCPFKSSGCNEKNSNSMDIEMNPNIFNRTTLENHLKSNQHIHLKLAYISLSKRLETLEQSNVFEMSKANNQFLNHEKLDFKEPVNINDSRYPSDHSNTSSGYGSMISVNASTSSNSSKSFEIKINEINVKLDMLENNQKNLMIDLTRLKRLNDNLNQEIFKCKENNKEYKLVCQELHRTLALTQVSLLTLEERLINQEKLSYNGTLLWKITNVQERIQEAKSGRQTSFYSPPFYTERNGFKMCARIYLNGDGNGRNTHLSLFFVILRGEYDALLKWPFRQKVTFILIDQSSSESKENVYDAFRPDPNSSSFRRPVSEMNIASGLPVFCPLGKLLSDDHQYIENNTMFIKIIVDTKDLSEI